MEKTQPPASPRWGSMTKLIISLTLVVILGAVLVRFKFVIVPVLMAFLLAYFLFPLASRISRKTPLSWAMTVNLIYVVIILILLALLTWGGVGLIGQVQNLISAIQHYATELPDIIADLSQKVFTIGPFHLDLSTIDWQTIGKQVLSYVEPALGKVGGLVGSLAGSAASTIGWLAFLVVVSYFFLLESGGLRTRIIQFDIPGYADDMRRLSPETGAHLECIPAGAAHYLHFKGHCLFDCVEHHGGSLLHSCWHSSPGFPVFFLMLARPSTGSCSAWSLIFSLPTHSDLRR